MDKCFLSCVEDPKATPNRDFKKAGKWSERMDVFFISVFTNSQKALLQRMDCKGNANVLLDYKKVWV